MVFGKKLNRYASPFLKDIDDLLKKDETILQKKQVKKKQVQLELF